MEAHIFISIDGLTPHLYSASLCRSCFAQNWTRTPPGNPPTGLKAQNTPLCGSNLPHNVLSNYCLFVVLIAGCLLLLLFYRLSRFLRSPVDWLLLDRDESKPPLLCFLSFPYPVKVSLSDTLTGYYLQSWEKLSASVQISSGFPQYFYHGTWWCHVIM